MPHRLRDLPSPPPRVFVRGSLPRAPCIAIVGTRAPTSGAQQFARELAAAVVGAGGVVASGGARGIDAAAHEGALEAGGQTLVVMPSGLDRPYPAEHAPLYARVVASGGALLSPFEAGTEARRHLFFRRNECLASLCHALVLVEAPIRSGARNATGCARKLGRTTFAVPAVPWNSRGRGCLVELSLGAELLSDPRAFLRRVGLASKPPASSPRPPNLADAPASPESATPASAASGLEAQLLESLAGGPEALDRLTERVARRVSEVQHALFTLTLSGRVERGPCGRFRLQRSAAPRR